jgi:hypothetical protein
MQLILVILEGANPFTGALGQRHDDTANVRGYPMWTLFPLSN